MSPQPGVSVTRYARLREIFLLARECAPADRAALLDAECGQDAQLRSELERLIEDDSNGPGFLDTPALDMPFSIGEPVPLQATVPQIDRYRIRRELGSGGMGTVFEAEQLHPVQRVVALKVIRGGLIDDESRARFIAERQALALLDHPGIAHVFDAGVTNDGRPYFVMDLVEGESITSYCKANSVSPAGRVELFMHVCDAVRHAHQRGIIHRDLKPSNILVSGGAVKIIDFGVAKAIDRPIGGGGVTTGVQTLIGTPAYMSPEQASGGARPIDVRCDIYSLGVILYELLVGAPPFDPQRLSALSIAELAKFLSEQQPLRPSVTLARNSDSDLRHVLSRDLDWIILKCLEKDRERRYGSVDALIDDIRRFREGDPVAARPPSFSYRAAKFIRKHRVAVAMASVTFVALTTALAITTAMYARSERLRLRAETAEREQTRLAMVADQRRAEASSAATAARAWAQDARAQLERREALTRLTSFMLRSGSAFAKGGRADATILEAAASAEEALESGCLDVGPRSEVDLRVFLGGVFYDRGQLQRAERQYRKAMELVSANPRDAESWANSRTNVATALIALGRFDEAEFLLDEAMDACRLEPRDLRAVAVITRILLAQVYVSSSRAKDAERLMLEALSEIGNGAPVEPNWIRAAYDQMGAVYHALVRPTDAEPFVRRVLELAEEEFPPGHPIRATALSNVAGNLYQQRRFAEAEPIFREALAELESALGSNHPNYLSTLKNLATMLADQSRQTEAEPMLLRVVTLRRAALGDNHPQLASDLFSLGTAYHGMRRIADAEAAYREAIEITRRQPVPDNRNLGDFLHNLCVLLYTSGRATEAETPGREALKFRIAFYGADHFKPAQSRSILGGVLTDLNQLDEAEPLLLAAYDVLKQNPPVPKNFLPDCLQRLVKLYQARNDAPNVEKYQALLRPSP